MSRTYECMFLIDNDAVRASWQKAKQAVESLVEKHGGRVLTARRWDERRLAYPIRKKRRGTYLLSYCEFPPESVNGLRRDLDISELVLRYLILQAEAVPAKETELSQAETAPDFVVPEPPPDDAPEPEEVEETAAQEAPASSEAEAGEEQGPEAGAEKVDQEEAGAPTEAVDGATADGSAGAEETGEEAVVAASGEGESKEESDERQ